MITRSAYLVIVISITTTTVTSIPLTSESSLTDDASKNTTTNNDEIAMQQAAENIKQIIAVEQREQASRLEYQQPIVLPKPTVASTSTQQQQQDQQQTEQQKELDKLTLEELKAKCKHLSALLNNANRTTSTITTTTISSTPPINRYGVHYKLHESHQASPRPVYIPRPLSSTYRPVSYSYYSTTPRPNNNNNNGFYITSSQSLKTPKPTTANNVLAPPQPAQAVPIKYIRLEPVILQKTILSDGRTMYYWHKSLPTAVEYANNGPPQPTPFNVEVSPNAQASSSSYVPAPSQFYHNGAPVPSNKYNNYFAYHQQQPQPPYNNKYVYSPNNYGTASAYYIPTKFENYAQSYPSYVENNQQSTTTTESTTTSTESAGTSTSQPYSGYGLGSFIPFYSFSKGEDSTSSTTTSSTTTTLPPEITRRPSTDNVNKLPNDDLMYAQQLKFVVPVPLEQQGPSYRYQWGGFDPYAYYPKELQPNAVNVQLPYSPTFHMIRAVQVPDNNNNRRIEDVSMKE